MPPASVHKLKFSAFSTELASDLWEKRERIRSALDISSFSKHYFKNILPPRPFSLKKLLLV